MAVVAEVHASKILAEIKAKQPGEGTASGVSAVVKKASAASGSPKVPAPVAPAAPAAE